MSTSVPRAEDLVDLEERIRSRGLSLGSPLVIEDEVGSTNDCAKAAAKEGAAHGATWLAESQTQGRGRQGRTWASPRGQNLLFSVLMRTPCPLARLSELSLVAGLVVRDAVARALGETETLRALVKWPNDVLIPELGAKDALASPKKVAGILVESTLSGQKVDSIVVGIGINVHVAEFPTDLADRATSVALSGAVHPDRATVLLDVLEGLERDMARVAARGLGDVHERLIRACALRGRRLHTGDARGMCEGIDRDGRLLVRNDAGELLRLSSGEVHLGRP